MEVLEGEKEMTDEKEAPIVESFEADTDIISQEHWDEMDKHIRKDFGEAANILKVYLFGCKTAKNYLALPFRYKDSKWDFDVVFRKKNCDPNIICPTCGNAHVINARKRNKQEEV
jgi:hypothetical protein